MGWPHGRAWWGSGEGGTFEKVDGKPSLVNGPVGDELEPEAAGLLVPEKACSVSDYRLYCRI